ncbi:MAG: hypothetical protein AB7W37_12330 [Syntrophobacteraceae bacterium]
MSRIQALHDNTVADELPEALLPEVFTGIQEDCREGLKSAPDPRRTDNQVIRCT